ncbi:MAG: hypothetical protein SFX73_31050 [Kofleriaceae bacterium]|nr:hypothetical protein [Kofleriaceae bacterium]
MSFAACGKKKDAAAPMPPATEGSAAPAEGSAAAPADGSAAPAEGAPAAGG